MRRKAEFWIGAVMMAAGVAVAAGAYGTGESKAAEVQMVGIMEQVQETEQPAQETEQVGTKTEQQNAGGTAEITEDSVYWPVVAQYREAEANNMYADLFDSGDWSAKGEFVNIELLNNARFVEDDMHFDVYYTIFDINQDDIPEFFIGGGVNRDSVVLYDMFTNDGENVVPVFEVSTLGYRSNLNVYEDNSFAVYGSSGAATNSVCYYTLPAQGTQPQQIEEYGIRNAGWRMLPYRRGWQNHRDFQGRVLCKSG